jgi:hypothetical protein
MGGIVVKRAIGMCGLVAAIGMCGCSHEPEPHQPTVAEIQAQIEKVKADPKMPANVKAMVTGQLQGALARAQHPSKSGS